MHKDKPPGIFAFAERSIRYLIGFWLVAGFLVSFVVRVGTLVLHADPGGGPPKADDALETTTAPVRKTTPQPVEPAVKY